MLDNLDLPATLTALGALVTAIGVVVIAILNYRKASAAEQKAERAAIAAEASDAEIVNVHGTLREVGKAIDGRLTKLLELTEKAALAKGKDEGIAAEKGRVAAEQKHVDAAVKKANGK